MTETPRGPGRPRISSREEIEEKGIQLLLDQGYAGVTFAALAQACGVSKSTLFRHFPSKAALVQTGFQANLEQLVESLKAQPNEVDALTEALPNAVVSAFIASADARGLWLKRFRVLESSEELSMGESAHWVQWRQVVAQFVGDRMGIADHDVIPASIAGAVQAAYVAILRRWSRDVAPSSNLAWQLRTCITLVCRTLVPLAGADELRS